MVETASIVNMCISGAFALLLPVTLLIVWRKKTHAPFVSAIVTEVSADGVVIDAPGGLFGGEEA